MNILYVNYLQQKVQINLLKFTQLCAQPKGSNKANLYANRHMYL